MNILYRDSIHRFVSKKECVFIGKLVAPEHDAQCLLSICLLILQRHDQVSHTTGCTVIVHVFLRDREIGQDVISQVCSSHFARGGSFSNRLILHLYHSVKVTLRWSSQELCDTERSDTEKRCTKYLFKMEPLNAMINCANKLQL